MSLLQALVLGLVQGLTEFIPISSSGHLVLVPWALGWPAPELAFDTTLHLGTLAAVLAFFANDYLVLARAWLSSLRSPKSIDTNARLAWFLIIGTIPAVVAGVLLESWFEQMFTQPALVGVFLLITAALLFVAEKVGRQELDLSALGIKSAVSIGLAQALAICPGISRSGATISAGMAFGLDRRAAARFSFLLSSPIILGAAISQILPLLSSGLALDQIGVLLVGFVVAAVSGYLCIGFLLRYLATRGLWVFSVYCAAIGLATILLAVVR